MSTTDQSTPEPPPVGGILWSIAGDIRSVLALPAATAMQVAHPGVGAGVDQHSAFRTDPWGRGERSLQSVQLWVYGGERAAREGRRLRTAHEPIRGVDAHGRPYHALDPALYAWVHATAFPAYLHAQRYLGRRPFTGAEERQLYAELLRVGRILGLEDRAHAADGRGVLAVLPAGAARGAGGDGRRTGTPRGRRAPAPARRPAAARRLAAAAPAVQPLPGVPDGGADAARRPRGHRAAVDGGAGAAAAPVRAGRAGGGAAAAGAVAVPPDRPRGPPRRPPPDPLEHRPPDLV
ncbi:LOW QUALITY PROTEIN: conserved hypothetical protein, partial [Streptomyces himastatinicus ATCC 53653]